MKQSTIVLLLAAVLGAAASCKSQYELLLSGHDSEAKYQAAFDYFNRGKYLKAAQLFESLSQFSSGSSRDDTVQYYWGLSNYRYKDYYTAEANFAKFLENFPRSPFADDATFLRIDCLYRSTLRYELDQTPTRSTMATIQQYLTETGGSHHGEALRRMLAQLQERLDKKDLENAKLYYRMEDYKAARVAFRNVLKENANNVYREEVLYYTALSSYRYAEMSTQARQRERYLAFIDDYLNFVGEHPESKYRRELDGLYKRAQRVLGRSTDPDEKNNETSGRARS